jgi:enoyl-CoA hydratase/carnithine racemase
MAHVRLVREDRVAVLYLGRGKANALNAELVDELLASVEQVASDPDLRALVVASDLPRMFCAGFDVSEVFAYDRARMSVFFAGFVRLFERLRSLPKPVVCALSGHAFAGGAILALAVDFRVMAEAATLSVNEVDLGVMLPPRMIRAMAANAGAELMRSMLLGAEVVAAPRALGAGLVSEVLPAAEVVAAAVRRAGALGAKPAAAFAAHKRALVSIEPGEPLEAEIESTIDAWFSPEASARRRALVDKLAKKAGPT